MNSVDKFKMDFHVYGMEISKGPTECVAYYPTEELFWCYLYELLSFLLRSQQRDGNTHLNSTSIFFSGERLYPIELLFFRKAIFMAFTHLSLSEACLLRTFSSQPLVCCCVCWLRTSQK